MLPVMFFVAGSIYTGGGLVLRNIYPWNGRDDIIFYYSDRDMKIKQIETGILYVDAADTYPFKFHYLETEIPIDASDDSAADT